jgi:hypothetical protein
MQKGGFTFVPVSGSVTGILGNQLYELDPEKSKNCVAISCDIIAEDWGVF